MSGRYRAIVSSDWNECLAPCGPFDFISFLSPEIEPELNAIFRQYTGNQITLEEAVGRIRILLPDPLNQEHMDAYLDEAFTTYSGVPNLIEWCLSRNILFMINSTGMIGYFQRIFARGLLPRVPVISAHPMVRFPKSRSDPRFIFDLLEAEDKAKSSAAVVCSMGIPADKIILIGDSGGDGLHFEWGSRTGAYLVGCMTKATLADYCRQKNIMIDLRFGINYTKDDKRDVRKEMQVDFMDLAPTIDAVVND
jgi:2-hydroxy-3-keto-5-methylthiopentenyl-1-phosphate phosphatase